MSSATLGEKNFLEMILFIKYIYDLQIYDLRFIDDSPLRGIFDLRG